MNNKYKRIKGRKLQILLRDKLLKAFKHLKKSDVEISGNGEIGADIKLSRIAKRLIPFQFEERANKNFALCINFLVNARDMGIWKVFWLLNPIPENLWQ